jgi:hypothetical protein
MNQKTGFVQNPKMFSPKVVSKMTLTLLLHYYFILLFYLGVISRNLKILFSSENFRRCQNFKKSWNKSCKVHIIRHNFYGKTFLDIARNQFFDKFFCLPLRTFCLKTSRFQQIHPPKFYFSGSKTY